MFTLDTKEDLYLGPIRYNEFDKELNETTFIVRDIMETKKTFFKVIRKLYAYMKQGFEREEVRKHPLKFKFKNDRREPVKTMEIRHFIVNLMLWYPFTYLGIVNRLNDSYIFECYKFNFKYLVNWINEKIIEKNRKEFRSRDISASLDDLTYLLSRIHYDLAIVMGTTLDIESFSDMRERMPRFKEITETVLPDGLQPKQIEDTLAGLLKEIVDMIVNDEENNNIKPFIASGKGINLDQFSQFAINGGLKPDVEGNVIPIPINSSFIHAGLNTVSSFYIDGQAGCKPLIMNKTVMGRSGHFSYKSMMLASSYRLSHTIHDCHSARPIRFHVVDEEYLRRINGRYWVDEDGDLRCINWRTDTDLIGKTINLRDPVTCCAHDGICHICYGDLYYTNSNPHFHAGKFAATQINNPLQQKILSSKHMNKTVSDMIEFGPEFDRFFSLDSSQIRLNPDSEEKFENWDFLINTEDIFVLDEVSKDSDFNYYTEKFYLVNKKTGKSYTIEDDNHHDIFLFSETAQLLKKRDNYIGFNLGDIDYSNPIANVNINNNELSTPLKNIVKLLDRVPHFGCTTIDEMVNKICELAICSGINVDNVHCSMLIKGLIRKTDDILSVPDFSDPIGCEDYQILTVSNALIYNPSLAVSISFEYMNKQIISPYTYRKYKKSEYDLFYKESIYNDSLRYYKERKAAKKQKKFKKRVKAFIDSHCKEA